MIFPILKKMGWLLGILVSILFGGFGIYGIIDASSYNQRELFAMLLMDAVFIFPLSGVGCYFFIKKFRNYNLREKIKESLDAVGKFSYPPLTKRQKYKAVLDGETERITELFFEKVILGSLFVLLPLVIILVSLLCFICVCPWFSKVAIFKIQQNLSPEFYQQFVMITGNPTWSFVSVTFAVFFVLMVVLVCLGVVIYFAIVFALEACVSDQIADLRNCIDQNNNEEQMKKISGKLSDIACYLDDINRKQGDEVN